MSSRKLLETTCYCLVGAWSDMVPTRPFLHEHYVIGYCHPDQFYDTLRANLRMDMWSNNPYVVDCFPADRVMVFKRDKGGRMRWRLLSDHPKYDKYKDEFSSGELWSMFGEGWVVDETSSRAGELRSMFGEGWVVDETSSRDREGPGEGVPGTQPGLPPLDVRSPAEGGGEGDSGGGENH